MLKLTNELFATQIRAIQDYYFNNDLSYPTDGDASSFLREVGYLSEEFTDENFDRALELIGSHVEFYDIEQTDVEKFKIKVLLELEKVSKAYEFEKEPKHQGTVH